MGEENNIKDKVKKKFSKTKKINKRKKIIIAAVIVVLLVGGYFGLRIFKGSEEAAAYEEVAVSRGDISVVISGTASVEPVDQYNVIALVSGEVLTAPFEEGDEIAEGDVLYTIDSSDEATTVDKAQLSLEQAQLEYNDVIDDINNLDVTATVSGELISINVEVGDKVSEGSVIATITNDDSMILTVPFNTQNAAQLSVGDTADVFLEDYLQTISGKVIYISSGTRVEDGYAVVKDVEIKVTNPGALTTANKAYATVNGIRSYASSYLENGTDQEILAEASGKVKKVNYKEGDEVSVNDVIAELTSDSIGLSAQSSALSLKNAELSLDDAYATLDNYTITSPIAGTVIDKSIGAGDTLDNSNSSTTMAVIADMSQLVFELNVDELDINKIVIGQEVTITADALEDQSFTGYVDNISIMGTVNSGVTTYPVRVVIDNANETGLLPGMNVTAEIVVKSSTNTLMVPVAAIVRGNMVLVPNNDVNSETVTSEKDATVTDESTPALTTEGPMAAPDGYKYVQVTLGINDDNFIEITSGLAEGDIVAVPLFSGMGMEAHGGMVVRGGGGF